MYLKFQSEIWLSCINIYGIFLLIVAAYETYLSLRSINKKIQLNW